VRRDSYLHTVRASAGPDGLQVTPLAVDYLVRDDVVLLRVRPGDVVIVRVLPTPDDTGLVGATLEVGAAAIPDLLLTQFPSRRWSSAGSSRFPKSVACIIATYGRRRSPAAIGWPSRCQRLPRRARLSFRARSVLHRPWRGRWPRMPTALLPNNRPPASRVSGLPMSTDVRQATRSGRALARPR